MNDITKSNSTIEQKKDRKIWVFDLEQLKNFHSCCALNVDTLERKVFVIHESRNDIYQYLEFLTHDIKGLIGFNNVNYDYPLIHYLLTDVIRFYNNQLDNISLIIDLLYIKSQQIVRSEYSSVAPWEVLIPQVDLYRIHHFDNKAKRTSLKDTQFVLRWNNVEDMPIKHYHEVRNQDIPKIISYNNNDVDSTYNLYLESLNDIKVRRDLRVATGMPINVYNYNDTKIGSELFLDYLSKELHIEPSELRNLRTHRKEIRLTECILPYINFKTKIFGNILKQFHETSITSTKNAFKFKAKFNGIIFDYGSGGLHACVRPGIYKKEKNKIIVDIDVSSFYPKLAIVNNFYPKHLGQTFCKIYKQLFDQRISIKNKKDKTFEEKLLAGVLKLVLNGVYGKSSDIYSFLYDPFYTMCITINGQLLLTMLFERISLLLEGCEILQVNTDGITIKIQEKDYDKLIVICNKWEKVTGLDLEYIQYKKMIIRDVNNYIGVKDKPDNEIEPEFPKSKWYDNQYTKHKLKGTFEVVKTQNGRLAFNKSWNQTCVSKAIHDHFIYNKDIRNVLHNNKDILDYCKRYKCTSGWKSIYVDTQGNEHELSKTTRYYMSINGGRLYKVHEDGRKQLVEAKGRVTILNKLEKKEFDQYNVDYSYYINECNKILFSVMNKGQIEMF